MVLTLTAFTNFHGFITGDPGLVTDLQQFKLLAHNWRLNWRHLFLSEGDYHLSLVRGKPNKHTTHQAHRQMDSHGIKASVSLLTQTSAFTNG